jgi:hypothetical protein
MSEQDVLEGSSTTPEPPRPHGQGRTARRGATLLGGSAAAAFGRRAAWKVRSPSSARDLIVLVGLQEGVDQAAGISSPAA